MPQVAAVTRRRRAPDRPRSRVVGRGGAFAGAPVDALYRRARRSASATSWPSAAAECVTRPDRRRRAHGHRQVRPGAGPGRAARRRDREHRRDADVPRYGHRDREAAGRRAARHPAPPARRARGDRDGHRRAIPAARPAPMSRRLRRGGTPVIVGGSMMYVQALLDEWRFPATDPEVRARLRGASSTRARPAALHRGSPGSTPSGRGDPRHRRPADRPRARGRRDHREPFAASAPRSARRAGTPRSSRSTATPPSSTRGSTLRTRLMFAAGLVDEVRAARRRGTARRGHRVPGDRLRAGPRRPRRRVRPGPGAASSTFIGTRRYVRRQRSWFRRDPAGRVARRVPLDLLDSALADAPVDALDDLDSR